MEIKLWPINYIFRSMYWELRRGIFNLVCVYAWIATTIVSQQALVRRADDYKYDNMFIYIHMIS